MNNYKIANTMTADSLTVKALKFQVDDRGVVEFYRSGGELVAAVVLSEGFVILKEGESDPPPA